MELFNLKDHSEKVSFSQAVVKGIGRDQGLFFPDHIEPLTNIDELLDLPLAERSAKILRHLIGDEIPSLEAIVKDATSPTPAVTMIKKFNMMATRAKIISSVAAGSETTKISL